jgi:AraC-like DNA-binding protein
MMPKILTHLGTTPIYYKKGRSKPFRLRVTIGGKRIERYFKTKAEAEAEWINLAPLAHHSGPLLPGRSLLSDHEAAKFLEARARLAEAGLSLDDAIHLAILSKGAEEKHPTVQEPSLENQTPSIPDQIQRIFLEVQKIAQSLGKLESGTVVHGRVLRSIKDAARYCGFKDTTAFLRWAEKMGFDIPRFKLVHQQRSAFLISELEATILRDPLVHRNKRTLVSQHDGKR